MFAGVVCFRHVTQHAAVSRSPLMMLCLVSWFPLQSIHTTPFYGIHLSDQ